jgi:Secretion system C-terminal sorting domain
MRSIILFMKAGMAIRLLFTLFIACVCNGNAIGQSISGVVNGYYQVTAINTATNTVSLNTVSGLSIGTKILIIQMKGATMDATNTASFGNITAINTAGNYEFNYICSISGNDATLEYQLIKTYDPTQQVQLVSVPVYQSVTVSANLTSNPWDPVAGTGGILAIEATDTIYLNSSIDVSGLGYQGGAIFNYPIPPYNCDWLHTVSAYYLSNPSSDAYQTGGKKGEGVSNYITGEDCGMGKQSNGGGGGNNTNTGGAGGGNFGAGGLGGKKTNESAFKCHGQYPGIGGLSLSPYGYSVAQNRIFFGGGGGAGHENNGDGLPGANGGGIVILTAPVMTGMGTFIHANGLAPVNPAKTDNPNDSTEADGDGGGGGGGGGTVIINVTKVNGSIAVQANGGNGSNSGNFASDCTGPGGGGGAGIIWASGAIFPAAITPSVTGGTNGVVSATDFVAACIGSSNSATPGANGVSQTGYVAPIGTSPVCAVLASSELIFFKANLTDAGAVLNWQINAPTGISSYQIQRSLDRVIYQTIGNENNDGELNMSFVDPQKMDGTIYYRLELVFQDGHSSYSEIVPLNRYSAQTIQLTGLQPNPASDQITLTFYAKNSTTSQIMICNAYGQRMVSQPYSINTGYTKITVPLSTLSSGIYFLLIEGNNIQVVKSFVKIGQP